MLAEPLNFRGLNPAAEGIALLPAKLAQYHALQVLSSDQQLSSTAVLLNEWPSGQLVEPVLAGAQ